MQSITYAGDFDVHMECCKQQQPALGLENSAFSTQDGFGFSGQLASESCYKDDVQWASGAAEYLQPTANDLQDCDATCTSRNTDLNAKQPPSKAADQFQHAGSSCPELLPASQDAAMTDQDSKSHQWQRLPGPERQQGLRAVQQQEELMEMIRNERQLEQDLSPSCSFLELADASGEHITPQMRMIVCSWLSEVACEFNMQQETLFLAVTLLDRFMSSTKGVPRSVLQLVAVACMLLASKQDEVVHPSVEELTDIAANCFQVQDLLRMERVLLDGLSWRIKTPTAYTFLHLFTQTTAVQRAAAQQQQQSCPNGSAASGHGRDQHAATAAAAAEPMQGTVVAKAAYLTELALLDYSSLAFKPSQRAAAALLLAQSWSEQGAAVQEMQQISGYSTADLQDCMGRLLHLHQCAAASTTSEALAPFTFIRDKYSQECWLSASLQDVPTTGASPALGHLANPGLHHQEGGLQDAAGAAADAAAGADWQHS